MSFVVLTNTFWDSYNFFFAKAIINSIIYLFTTKISAFNIKKAYFCLEYQSIAIKVPVIKLEKQKKKY